MPDAFLLVACNAPVLVLLESSEFFLDSFLRPFVLIRVACRLEFGQSIAVSQECIVMSENVR